MKIKYLNITLVITIFLIALSCNNNKKGALSDGKYRFEIPQIPSMITDQEGQAKFLAAHYWDTFDFQDTTTIGDLNLFKNFYYNYLGVLSHIERDQRKNSMLALSDKILTANPSVCEKFIDLIDYSLNDPNSTTRDEDIYIAITERMIDSGKLLLEHSAPLQFKLDLARKNCVGMPANDFSITLDNGKSLSIYSISAQYSLLIFYNPECKVCIETITAMRDSEVLTRLVSAGRVKVVAIYTDPDTELWKRHTGDIPAKWINGYDKEMQIQNERLYDCRPSPSLYLLDKGKKVVMKDANFMDIEEYLKEN